MDRVEKIMREKEISFEEVKTDYDEISSNLSKSLLVLLIPLIAAVGLIYNRNMQFGKHLIFATHFFSQFLLATTILYVIATNIQFASRWYFMLPVILMALFYYTISIQVFYGKTIPVSIIYAVLGLIFLILFIEIYRGLITALSLSLV